MLCGLRQFYAGFNLEGGVRSTLEFHGCKPQNFHDRSFSYNVKMEVKNAGTNPLVHLEHTYESGCSLGGGCYTQYAVTVQDKKVICETGW
jgi:hypothetical protein